MELDLLTFSHDGVERKCRRINLADYAATRERIRRERLDALGQHPDPATIAATVAQPVTGAELFERMLDVEGNAFILYRCVHEVDETFTAGAAAAMVLAGEPFVQRLYEGSHLDPFFHGVIFIHSDMSDLRIGIGTPGNSVN